MDYTIIYSMIEKRAAHIMDEGKRFVIAVDGPSGAGKTTLGKNLAERFDAALFHMDDFFLRPEQRVPERLERAGGNIDAERFDEEISQGILSGKDFYYRPFFCSKMQLGDPIKAEYKPISIIEGVYSHHPDMILPRDLKIFLDIPREIQPERLKRREGPEKLDKYMKIWIPAEEKYFSEYKIKKRSDMVINGEK